MKRIQITMPDNSVWEIPANVVASNRADFFHNKAGGKVAEREYSYTMKHDEELLDWAENNMNWNQVYHVAKCVKPPPPLTPSDFQEGWVNGPKDIVE